MVLLYHVYAHNAIVKLYNYITVFLYKIMCKHILTCVSTYAIIQLQGKQYMTYQISNISEVQAMSNTNININNILKELKDYTEMQKQLAIEIEQLQAQVKQHMTDNNMTECFNDDMTIRCTFSEVISNRFDSTNFKKTHADLYNAFLKKSTSMRFTIK